MANEIGSGFEAICGMKKEAAWAGVQAVTVALPFLKESYTHEYEQIKDEVCRGHAGVSDAAIGNQKAVITPTFNLTYEDLDILLALGMGASGVPSVSSGAYFINNLTLLDNLPITNSCTLAIHKNVSVWEYLGCIPNTIKISGSANNPLELETELIASSLSLDSATNTLAILAALSTVDLAGKVMMSDLTFKIAAQATTLAAEDYGIDSFEFILNNNLAVDQFDNKEKTIIQPRRTGNREVLFNFTVPRYEADLYADWGISGARLNAQLSFASGSYRFIINIPNLRILPVQIPVEGPGLMGQKIEAVCNRDIPLGSRATGSFTYTPWSAEAVKAVGAVIVPTTENGHRYKCVSDSGTTATAGNEPTWTTTANSEITDGSGVTEMTWTEDGTVDNEFEISLINKRTATPLT